MKKREPVQNCPINKKLRKVSKFDKISKNKYTIFVIKIKEDKYDKYIIMWKQKSI